MTDQLLYEGTLASWDGDDIVLEAPDPPGSDCTKEELAAWSARCVDINVPQLRQHLRGKRIRITIDILD
jgi:hypothetical protein